MDNHKNARSCAASRALLVRRILEQGWSLRPAAEAAGLSERSAYKWLARYREQGAEALEDRSSCPRRMPTKTPDATVDQIVALRRQRRVGAEIAARLGLPRSTVARILKHHGLGKLRALDPPPAPVKRYCRRNPGELSPRCQETRQDPRHRAARHRRSARPGSGCRLGVCPRLCRRCLPPRLRRDPARRAKSLCGGVPRACARLVYPPRCPSPGRDDRQRSVLHLEALRRGLLSPGLATCAHPTLSAAHQRQGRALHSNPAARMGLSMGLSILRPAPPPTPSLPALLQPPPTAPKPRLPTLNNVLRMHT